MQILSQLIFVAFLGITAYLVAQRVRLIKKSILLGRAIDRKDQPQVRLKKMLLLAFGQKKMFTRPVVGFLHLLIYLGFILINIEILEILVDGIFGTHRVMLPLLGSSYKYFMDFFEILAAGVLLACVVFLIRRNILKIKRLCSAENKEMKKWPLMDANLILIIEISLMLAFLKMNAADTLLQARGVGHFAEAQTGNFIISQFMQPFLAGFSDNFLLFVVEAAWWFHIVGIFFFTVYVTYSKHLHIALAFPNTYFSDLNPIGEMPNMPAVTKEVKIMLGLEQAPSTAEEVARFGAKDVQDLTWKNLMDAYTCTECGRCTSSCPAHITGKALSPRKIMMDTRDRMEDLQKNWKINGEGHDDGKSLLGDYIKDEEILACTSCNACAQECPVMINPLDIITQLKRYRVMEESQAPQSWNMMFQNLETNQAPWKFSPDQRFDWSQDVK